MRGGALIGVRVVKSLFQNPFQNLNFVNMYRTAMALYSDGGYPCSYLLREWTKMVKRAVIVVSLVEESTEKSNREIEKEIMTELSSSLPFSSSQNHSNRHNNCDYCYNCRGGNVQNYS